MPTEDATPVVPATPVTGNPLGAATPNSDTGNAPGSETSVVPAEKSGEKLFTQADLERQIDDRLKRERSKAEAAATKAAKEAEDQRAATAGEYQKLAEDRKTTIEQLTPKAELADKLSEIFTKQLDAELATWPEEAQPLVLPADSPLLQRIESADRARPIAQKLLAAQGAVTVATPGIRFPAQHPGGNGQPVTTKTVAESALKKAYAPRPAKS